MTKQKILIHAVILGVFASYWLAIDEIFKSTLEIIDYGPKQFLINVTFNKQQEDVSAIWIRAQGDLGENTKVVWDGRELVTTIDRNNHVVTAVVPRSFYAKAGEYKIYLFDRDRNIRSNEVVFLSLDG